MAKLTPLAEIHGELDAKMIPFCGWNLPANYPGGAVAEHKYTRKYCSLFDASHNGRIRVAGPGCLAFLAPLTAGNIAALPVGECVSTFLFSEEGTLIDALLLLHMAEDDCFIAASTVNTAKVLARLQEKMPEDILIQDLTDPICQLTLAGPAARDVLLETADAAEKLPEEGHCGMIVIAEDLRCIICRTDTCGEQCFDLFCSADNAIDLWDELTCIEPVRPAGISAKDSLRIEAGIPLAGEEYTPDLTRADLEGGSSAQWAFLLLSAEGKQAPRKGDKVFFEGTEIGTVTSSTQGPCLAAPGAICKVAAASKPACGAKVVIKGRDAEITAEVVPHLYIPPKR